MQQQQQPRPEPEPGPITLVTRKIKYGDREKSRLVGTQLRGTPFRRNHLNVCMTPVAATWTPQEGTRPPRCVRGTAPPCSRRRQLATSTEEVGRFRGSRLGSCEEMGIEGRHENCEENQLTSGDMGLLTGPHQTSFSDEGSLTMRLSRGERPVLVPE